MKSFDLKSVSGRSKKRLSVFVALWMALLLCLTTACSQKPTEASSSSASVSVSSMSSAASSSEPSSSEEPESSSSSRAFLPGEENAVPDPVVPIETNYITVYFPEELTADMTLEHLEENGHQLIAFSSTFSGKELRLFSVVFGPAGSGPGDFQLGVLKDETAGEVPVSIRMNVQNETDWSAENFERINRLQERVNDLIIQFYEDPRFIPNH